MIHILVTGSSGQLGQSIQKLAGQYPQLTFRFTNRSDLDISQKESVKEFFTTNRYDYCINCAAYTNVEQAEQTPEAAYEVNDLGVANLADACKLNKIILLHISTDYVFDGLKTEGYYATDEPNPINEYGKSKWEGEKRIQELLNEYFIVRTSWLYSKTGSNFYTKILKSAKGQKKISVTTEQRGCPTHADHLAKYILDLISQENKNYGIHHFTDGEAMTWYEFANKILYDEGLLKEVELSESATNQGFAKRPANSVLIP